MLLFLKAVGFGLAVAAPVGPMSMLCMRRSLMQGWRAGLATGAGIATGDAMYALVAALGLATVSKFMLAYDRPLHLAAGLFLLYLGFKTFWTSKAAATEPPTSGGSTASIYAGSVLLTLTNPPTIIAFAAIFAALAPHGAFTPGVAFLTVGGVFVGSAVWWCMLVTTITAAGRTVTAGVRSWIARIAALFLAGFGVTEVRRAL